MTEETENKTIVVSYDDITRMKDYCCDESGVTREFMDWYVNEETFFTRKGVLISGYQSRDVEKQFVISFDFTNPEIVEFVMYDHLTNKPLCKYRFIKEDNLAMKDVNVLITWFDKKAFANTTSIFSDKSLSELKPKSLGAVNHKTLSRKGLIQRKHKLEAQIDESYKSLCKYMAEQGVYYAYAAMYYFANNKMLETTGKAKSKLLGDTMSNQIASIYKYTGYINLEDIRVYAPKVDRDPNEPIREYGRHIQKWSVRGHYRRVGDKRIWIESFEKGEGELETRVYGTTKEPEIEIIPKEFEVMRNVSDVTIAVPRPITQKKEVVTVPVTEPIKAAPDKYLNRVMRAWSKLIKLLKLK